MTPPATRIERPVVTEAFGGYQRKCANCSFKPFSLNNPNAPAVHVCSDHAVVKWEGKEVHGQKTVPLSEAYLKVLAAKEAKKGARK